MLTKLPGWVVSNHESVEREAAPYRGMSPEQRWKIGASLCLEAERMLATRADAAKVHAWRDRLPASSRALWARLRTLSHRNADG